MAKKLPYNTASDKVYEHVDVDLGVIDKSGERKGTIKLFTSKEMDIDYYSQKKMEEMLTGYGEDPSRFKIAFSAPWGDIYFVDKKGNFYKYDKYTTKALKPVKLENMKREFTQFIIGEVEWSNIHFPEDKEITVRLKNVDLKSPDACKR